LAIAAFSPALSLGLGGFAFRTPHFLLEISISPIVFSFGLWELSKQNRVFETTLFFVSFFGGMIVDRIFVVGQMLLLAGFSWFFLRQSGMAKRVLFSLSLFSFVFFALERTFNFFGLGGF